MAITVVVNVVLTLGAKIGECLKDPVGRQFGYFIDYKSKVEDLKHEVQKLEERRGAVQLSVDAADRNGEVIGPDVKGWLVRVKESSSQARTILEDESEANKRCLFGWCPNLKSRYSLGKKASKKAEEVAELHEQGNFPAVSYTAPSPGIESISTERVKGFESRRLIMNNVMEALKDDRFHMIGICGMGGVGKTTMVKQVAKRAKKENLFDEVVIAVVSQSPDKRKIQGEIADKVDLTFKQESVSGRADRLRERLKNIKRILLILDDVWKRLELNDIGIPFGDGHRGCKILLTSRVDDVCNDMEAEKKFIVPALTTNEAWNLFKEMAGISNDTSHTSTDLYFTQKAVATECGGLPIAIVTVARALKDKDKPSWDSALQQLQKSIGKNIRGVNEHVFKPLELSYNYIESEEAKKCFLLCSLYPEDFNIPIEDLVRYGFGIELFEAIDRVGQARDRVHAFVDDLKKCHLLMDGEEKECVKMHDVIRDVAISIAYRREHSFMVRCDEALKEWPKTDQHKNCVVISLKLNGMHWLPDNLEFPKLHLLKLDCNAGLPSYIWRWGFKKMMEEVKVQETPDSFYQGMKDLRVLALSDMYGSLPTSLRCLTNLRTLSFFHCRLIDVSIIGALKNLEILRFADSYIEEFPKEIGPLVHLKVLDLFNCKLKKFYPGVLSSFSMLEELYFGFSLIEGTRIEESTEIIAELASLSNLVALDVNLDILPRDQVIEKVKRFNIRVKPSSTTTSQPYSLSPNKLEICSIDVTDLMGSSLKMLLKSTEIMHLESVKGLKNILSDLEEDCFERLTNLSLKRCRDLEYLINTTDEVVLQRASPFPLLQHLCLSKLNNFKGIICHGQLLNFTKVIHLWMGPTPLKWLGNLRHLEMEKCDKVDSVFSLSMARNLMHLENIKIWRCHMMEVIVSSEGGEHEIAAVATTDKIDFPKLKSLNLRGLPNFTAFCKAMNAIELPQLEDLNLEEIPKLTSLCPASASASASEGYYDANIQPLFDNKVKLTFLKRLTITAMDNLIEIWPSRFQAKLRVINVHSCHMLSNTLFPSNLIEGMQSLEILRVMACHSVKVAFDLEGLIVKEGHLDILLPSLTHVHLRHLPKLTHVWNHNLSGFQGFQNLSSLTIQGCGSLRYVFSSSLAKLLVKLQKIEVIECRVMEVIIGKEPKVDDEIATNILMFPQLNSLKLSDLPNLWSFCHLAYTFEGSLLKTVEVINCPNMKAFPSPFQGTQELQRSNVPKANFFTSSQHHLLDAKFILSSEGELTITGINEIWHNQLDVGCLHKVRVMQVRCCAKLSSVVLSNLMQRLPKIEELKVWWCDSLEMIFDLQGEVCAAVGEEETSISPLNNLELKYLPKLTHIWKNIPQQTHCFENLESLKVERCDNLRCIFTISMANALGNLKDLRIAHCEKVEKIVTRENAEEILSRRFHNVTLVDLPSIVCFGPDINDTKIPVSLSCCVTSCFKFPDFDLQIGDKTNETFKHCRSSTLQRKGDLLGMLFSVSVKMKKLEK